ncbi:MAG: hypothetical protein CYPHOPRED_001355, partial [Cyphobasidiales sp. Tagirdzhanova-0007]
MKRMLVLTRHSDVAVAIRAVHSETVANELATASPSKVKGNEQMMMTNIILKTTPKATSLRKSRTLSAQPTPPLLSTFSRAVSFALVSQGTIATYDSSAYRSETSQSVVDARAASASRDLSSSGGAAFSKPALYAIIA